MSEPSGEDEPAGPAPAGAVPDDPDQPRRVRPAAWLPVLIAVLGCVVLSAHRFLHLANTDALLPGLMATEHLTWFYWGQDRLANLVPALTVPIQDLRWNLAAQAVVVGSGFFALIGLLASHHLAGTRRRVRPMTVAVAIVVAGALATRLLTVGMEYILLFEQLYALATALLLAGLTAMLRGRGATRVAGWIAVVAATMLNPSLVLLAPVVLVIPPARGAWLRRAGVAIGGMVVAFALAILASILLADAPAATDRYSELSVARMVDFLPDALDRVGDRLDLRAVAVVLVASVAVLGWRAQTMTTRLRATYLGAPVLGLAWTFLFAGNGWVVANQLHPRYFFPLHAAALLLVTGAVTEVVAVVAARWPRASTATVGSGRPATSPTDRSRGADAVAAVAGVAVVVAALWSTTRVDVDALVAAEPRVTTVEEHDVDLVVGDYWLVWPTVVEARAQGLDVHGVTERSDAVIERALRDVDADLGAGGSVRVLCTQPEERPCLDELERVTGRAWEVTEVIEDDPLVVAVDPR